MTTPDTSPLPADAVAAIRECLGIILSNVDLVLLKPQNNAQQAQLEGIREAALAASSRLPGRVPTTIVVVDDEPLMRNMLQRWLEPRGFNVVTAQDAAAALSLVASLRPAVVLCDVNMPGHDGVWLAQRIRDEFPDTAIIFATGNKDLLPTQTLRKGVIGYLLKPFDRDRLLLTVDEAVRWAAHH
ncbi:MAG TPA: response regulator [Vicinamibacterales bacterium]|nr:response regulator [Vicinamibacterales bacterium]